MTGGMTPFRVTTSGTGGGDMAWHFIGEPGEPAFQNGATTAAEGYEPAFLADGIGGVHIKGRVNPHETSAAVVVFTLPAKYRPKFSLQYPMTTNTGSVGRINIGAAGNVSVAASNTWINIGVYFTTRG